MGTMAVAMPCAAANQTSGVWELLWAEQGSLGETLLQVFLQGRNRRRDGQRESGVSPAMGSYPGELL